MNKDKIDLYNKALAVVIDKYGITERDLFHSNEAECVNARMALVVGLHNEGMHDKDIAELTKKMRRCSVCAIRNRYKDNDAEWDVRRCIEAIKGNR